MRIIAGEFRGRPLAALGTGDTRAHLRPTPDRVRESLFSVISARLDWGGVRVLDLFAGTGALGLEALSRGAGTACFVEQGRAGQRLIAQNIKALGVGDRTWVFRCDATRLPPAKAPADLVFLDPPYGKGLGEKALLSARAGGWIAPDAMIVWEENAPQDAPDGFTVTDQRRYGTSHVTFLNAGRN